MSIFDRFKKKEPRDASKLGMSPEKLQAMHEAGLLDRESLGLQLDATGDKTMESAEAGREVAAAEESDAANKKKEGMQQAGKEIKKGSEEADALVQAASRDAEAYGSRLTSERRDSFAEALEKMKMSKRRT